MEVNGVVTGPAVGNGCKEGVMRCEGGAEQAGRRHFKDQDKVNEMFSRATQKKDG